MRAFIHPFIHSFAGSSKYSLYMATCKCTGEVFVLDDGSETDLDLGNYERFLDIRLTHNSNLTTGTSTKTSIHTHKHICVYIRIDIMYM